MPTFHKLTAEELLVATGSATAIRRREILQCIDGATDRLATASAVACEMMRGADYTERRSLLGWANRWTEIEGELRTWHDLQMGAS